MQSPTGEPMSLGSPQSPLSSGGHTQNQYLPAFLMGEPTPALTSPTSTRIWQGSTTSPPQMISHHRSSWGSPSSSLNQSQTSARTMFAQSPRVEPRASGRKEKAGAPPVQGLFESMHTATPSSGRKMMLDVSQSSSFRQTPNVYNTITPGLHTPGGANTSVSQYGQPPKTPPSPAQRDPFYTQGDNLKAQDDLDETWITVFGFPPAATSYILQQFSQYGSIVKRVIASEGNWMHIKFQSKVQAKKALSKNGRIFGGCIMVGVTPCIDKAAMVNDDKENTDSTFRTSFMGTPTKATLLQQSMCDNFNTSQTTPIRPLTAAYKAAQSDHEVVGQSNTPQKNTGILSKTMEYVFGW
ncbi:hypothetical protein LSH36_255g01006 [Paralvinella palmiformis]|uniref:Nucleoporin NUP53 n=1 Tax=Paralvinella palmiformis TaxID=53620 RepID=A0AAD9JLB9_9ANNE|nr:hypothetical protein LSH36_255g01006 [Paralvinella palmiformis]